MLTFHIENGRQSSTVNLDAICNALDCQPGDILEYRSDKKYYQDQEKSYGTNFIIFACLQRLVEQYLYQPGLYARYWNYSAFREYSNNIVIAVFLAYQSLN